MEVANALSFGRSILCNSLESEMLLGFIAGKSREFFITHPEFDISEEKFMAFREFCAKRASGIPLAYLTHHVEFYGLDFYVDERVFIPRSETELLVEMALSAIRNSQFEIRNSKFCDVGTGSGCIAITLAKYLQQAKIMAIDISEPALEVAVRNGETHGVSDRIKFLKSDLLSEISNIRFDGIVANLPYIGTLENHLVSREVFEHEPKEALFSGNTGLELYEKLFAQIRILPKLPQWFIGEMGFLQQEGLEKLIHKYFGNISMTFKNDFSGLPRLFLIHLCTKN